MSVCQQAAALIQFDPNLHFVQFSFGQGLFGNCSRRCELLLFASQVFQVDSVGVVGSHQLVALGVNGCDLTFRAQALAGLVWQHLADVLQHKATNLPNVGFGQRHGRPVILHEPFNDVDLCCPELAAVLVVLPAKAVEIVV